MHGFKAGESQHGTSLLYMHHIYKFVSNYDIIKRKKNDVFGVIDLSNFIIIIIIIILLKKTTCK